MSKQILALIRETKKLSEWWDSPEGLTYMGMELVEKSSTAHDDSYGQMWSGDASMVFNIGGVFYKVSAYHSSYDSIDWDNRDQGYYSDDPDYDTVVIKKVTPKVRSVSHYE